MKFLFVAVAVLVKKETGNPEAMWRIHDRCASLSRVTCDAGGCECSGLSPEPECLNSLNSGMKMGISPPPSVKTNGQKPGFFSPFP